MWIHRPYPKWPNINSAEQYLDEWIKQYAWLEQWLNNLPSVLHEQWMQTYGKALYHRWVLEKNILFSIDGLKKETNKKLLNRMTQACYRMLPLFQQNDRPYAKQTLAMQINHYIDKQGIGIDRPTQVEQSSLQSLSQSLRIIPDFQAQYNGARHNLLTAEEKAHRPLVDAQQQYATAVLKLITQMSEYASDLLGPAPCPFTLVGLGDLARLSLNRASDLSLCILAENNRDIEKLIGSGYLSQWSELVLIQLKSCGLNVNQSKRLWITTPNRLARRVRTRLNEQSTSHELYDLLHSQSIYSVDQDITPSYHHMLYPQENSALRTAKGYVKVESNASSTTGSLFNFKRLNLAFD